MPEEIIQEVKEYLELSDEIANLEEKIKPIKTLLSSKVKKFKKIEEKVIKIVKKAENSTLELKEMFLKLDVEQVSLYKVARPDYKSDWEEALLKVNSKTREVLEKIQRESVATKKLKTKDQLNITKTNESINEGIKDLWNEIKDIFVGFIEAIKGLTIIIELNSKIKAFIEKEKRESEKFYSREASRAGIKRGINDHKISKLKNMVIEEIYRELVKNEK